MIDVSPAVWKGPVLHVASMCQHVVGPRHRFVVLDLGPLVMELAVGLDGAGAAGVAVPLGGVQMGRFGLVVKGFAATDIWAVMRNVLWEDEHCAHCCGAMLRFIEPIQHVVLTRCGPTIGA